MSLIQEMVQNSISFFVTNVMCETSFSNPACNISWEFPGILLSEEVVEKGNSVTGFTTKSAILINISHNTDDQDVFCNASCGDFTLISKALTLATLQEGKTVFYLLIQIITIAMLNKQ